MTSYVHKMCERTYGQINMKRAITLAKINYPWNRYMCMFRSWPTKIPVIALFMFVGPYVRSHILCTQLVICLILFIFGILIGYDLSMCILCRFHGWLIFARVIALFILFDKIPNMNKMRQMTSCVHKMCERTYGPTNMKRAITLAKINHPWNRYTMRMLTSWSTKIPNMNKIKQKTSCVHKMCGRTYGQTNMKRAITLAKINHPWNWYNMHMLRSWPTKIPNMNKIQQKTND
jgi:hypothetical protein